MKGHNSAPDRKLCTWDVLDTTDVEESLNGETAPKTQKSLRHVRHESPVTAPSRDPLESSGRSAASLLLPRCFSRVWPSLSVKRCRSTAARVHHDCTGTRQRRAQNQSTRKTENTEKTQTKCHTQKQATDGHLETERKKKKNKKSTEL